LGGELSEKQLIELSKWEAVNFFSLNIHGIKDLLNSVIDLIYTDDFGLESEYFSHFIDEENTHMWFFANFCRRYGGKIYDSKRATLASHESSEIKNFVTFSKILIFERMVGFYNGEMMKDDRLAVILKDINRMHFTEESRHLAMGHELIRTMGRTLRNSVGHEELADIETYLRDYAKFCVDSFYNPAMYRDAGIDEPYKFRRELMADQGRQEINQSIVSNALRPFENLNIFAA